MISLLKHPYHTETLKQYCTLTMIPTSRCLSQHAAKLFAILLAGIAYFAIFVTTAQCQTPTVSIVNNSRGGYSVFYVGDSWTVAIENGQANAEVIVSTSSGSASVGYTNGTGQFSLDGTMVQSDVGTWHETWTVGGVTASPSPLSFVVNPVNPTVSILNTSIGGSEVFYVGNAWTVGITNGPANAEVVVSTTAGSASVGYTNSQGSFSLSGYMSSLDVGTWNETWTVGGIIATPDPLSFVVYPAQAATCDFAAAGPGTLFSLDYVDSFTWEIVYQASGSGVVHAALNPAGYCHMFGDSWNIGGSMYAFRTSLGTYFDEWAVGDAGGRPGFYLYAPEDYYPFFDTTALGFLAINITNGDFYFIPVIVGSYVEFVWF